jgi:hypothetical protein
MTVQPLSDHKKTPIGDILMAAGSEGILLKSEDERRYALIPLDDDLIDYLIERSESEVPRRLQRDSPTHGRRHVPNP